VTRWSARALGGHRECARLGGGGGGSSEWWGNDEAVILVHTSVVH
jgi:hypothetical protein